MIPHDFPGNNGNRKKTEGIQVVPSTSELSACGQKLPRVPLPASFFGESSESRDGLRSARFHLTGHGGSGVLRGLDIVGRQDREKESEERERGNVVRHMDFAAAYSGRSAISSS
jgi:hypothetical protein